MQSSSLTAESTRIVINKRTARWGGDEPVTAADALDFWSFAAGAANVVMQLSLPGVGYGVVESKVDSGNLLIHPWKRARTTFTYIAVAVIGTDEDKLLYREAVNSAHRHVKSASDSPVRYNAFDRDLQMWVAACLFVGLEDTYQLLRGEMTPPTRPRVSTVPPGRWAPPCRSAKTSGRPPAPTSTTTGTPPADASTSTTPSAPTCLICSTSR